MRISEAQLQAGILDLAALLGWRRAHFRAAQLRSGEWATHMSGETGWPDLALCRHGVLVVAELKRSGKHPEPEQLAWLGVLSTVPGVVAVVWRPEDWISGEIERVLREAGALGWVRPSPAPYRPVTAGRGAARADARVRCGKKTHRKPGKPLEERVGQRVMG